MSDEATGPNVAGPIDTDAARARANAALTWASRDAGIALQRSMDSAADVPALCDELDRLRAERDDLATRLSGVLCDLTRGRMSKTGYEVRTMVQEIEAVFEAQFEEEHAADIAERDDALRKIAKVRTIHRAHECTSSTYPNGCSYIFGGICCEVGHCAECQKVYPCDTITAIGDPS